MAKVFGKPSPFLREKGIHHLGKSALMAFGGMAIILILSQTLRLYPNMALGLFINSILAVVIGILAYKYYKEDDRASENYSRGREGENIILEELRKLPDEFRIFCDIQIHPPYNIDYVVLGPTGIFAVEVKSHAGIVGYKKGKITINNFVPKEKDFIRQAKGEAGSVAEYLRGKTNINYWVNPVLTFSNPKAYMYFGLKPVNEVFVVQRGFLLPLLNSKGQQHSEAVLSELEKALAQLT